MHYSKLNQMKLLPYWDTIISHTKTQDDLLVKYEVIKDYKTSDLDSRVDAYLSSSFSSSFSFSDLAYFNSELGL